MKGCDKSYTHPSSLRKHIRMHEMQQLANSLQGSSESSVQDSPIKQESVSHQSHNQFPSSASTTQSQQQQLLTTANATSNNSTFSSSNSSSSSSANTSRNSFTESPPAPPQPQTAFAANHQSAYFNNHHMAAQYHPYHQYHQHNPSYGFSVSTHLDYQHPTPNSFTQSTSPSSTSSSSSINSMYTQHHLAQQLYGSGNTNEMTPLKINHQTGGQGAPKSGVAGTQVYPGQNLNDWYMNSYQSHTGILTPPSTGNSPLINLPGQYLSAAAAAAAAAHHRMQALAHCN